MKSVTHPWGTAVLLAILLTVICLSHPAAATETWIGTWASGQQLVNTGNTPASPYLANNTLRQIVHATVGGSRIRVQFSNKYSTGSTTINSAHIALSNSSYPINSSIDTSTDTALTFSGSASVTIPAGEEIYSDAVDFNVPPLSNLTVSIYFGSDASSTSVTGHPGSRTSYYIKDGNTVSDAEMESGYKTEHWYILSRIDVWLDDSYGCVVALGDSITDGRGCNPNYDNRWPDLLAARLNADPKTSKVGVINQGIGANGVLSDNPTGGPSALNRYDHDVIGQPGVKWVIIFEGTNDIGGGASSSSLISAYQEFITKAHNAGLKIYGATITPFRGSGYYSTSHESVRDAVNDWIRTSGEFDGVIDFDAAVWDPADHDYLNPAYRIYPPDDINDFLHFNADGFQAMVDATDLTLFEEQRGTDAVNGNMMLINDNGGWCWYQDEKIAYDPVGRNVLTSTAAENHGFGGVGGARYDDVDATTFNIDTGKRTRALMCNRGQDDHSMGAFWIRPDGKYLHLYCEHYTNHITYYRLATYPNDGSAWDSEQSYNWLTIPNSPGSDPISNSSYTNIVYLSGEGTGQGRLYNIHRVFDRTPCLAYSDNWGQNWTYMGRLNEGVIAAYSNFYHKFIGNGVDRIDFIGNENHPRNYNNSVYHGYIQDGNSYNSYGVEMDTINDQDAPQITEFTKIFAADQNQTAGTYHTAWADEIQLDEDGYPVCLYQTRYGTDPWGDGSGQNTIGAADHRFFYARFNGTTWTSTELCKMGTGMHTPEQDYLGIGCIHPDDANLIYVSTPFDPRDDTALAHREIFKGVTYDKGLTWNWTQITFNSTEDNIRPAIPKWDANNTAVFWTRGAYPGQEDYDFVVVGMVEEQGMTLGLVSYTDASPSNTTNADGSAFSPTGPSGSVGSADNLWHEYTGYGNGGSCYTAGDGGTENVPTIKTTITGLSDGTYDVFAYFWCDPNLDWGIRGGFASDDANMLCFNKQSSQFAEASQFSGSVTVTSPGYRLYRVYIGRKEISGGGSIVVYLDNYDSTYSLNIPTRTTYDGIGVAGVSLVNDVLPPEPNVMTWATTPTAAGPTSITMTATTATDTSPPVLYDFECTTDGNKTSGWQISPTYAASGLSPSTLYSFRVKARDSSPAQNETDWSSTESATTDPPDTTPPTPNPMTWQTVPAATGPYSITMTATTATDACCPPVEYYFECTSDGSKTSGWQSSTTYSPSGLNPSTLYSFRVKARDSYLTPNETSWSSTESATTEAPPTNVEILGSWVTGLSHTKESGGNRALIFIAHEESESGDPSLTSVTYGGQEMTKVIEISAVGSSYGNYVAAFILDEDGIDAATSSTFDPTWSTTLGVAVAYSSVFLQNVNQTAHIGAKDSAGTTSGTDPISTDPLATNDEDMVILAATCNNLGSYTLGNGFTEGAGTDQQFGNSTTGGTGVAGYKAATGASETPSADYSSTVGRQVIIGFVVQAGGAADPPPAVPTGLSATPGNETIFLDWDENTETDLDGYNVYRSTTQGSGYGKLNVSLVVDSNYTDDTVTNGIPYYYVVTAVDFNGHESGNSNEATATPDYQNCADVKAGGYRFASDLSGDCYVNYLDLKVMADHWLSDDCTGPDNCEGADFEPADGDVDLHDFSDFAIQWLLCNNPEDEGCTPNW